MALCLRWGLFKLKVGTLQTHEVNEEVEESTSTPRGDDNVEEMLIMGIKVKFLSKTTLSNNDGLN